jgi:hypothetical protein
MKRVRNDREGVDQTFYDSRVGGASFPVIGKVIAQDHHAALAYRRRVRSGTIVGVTDIERIAIHEKSRRDHQQG